MDAPDRRAADPGPGPRHRKTVGCRADGQARTDAADRKEARAVGLASDDRRARDRRARDRRASDRDLLPAGVDGDADLPATGPTVALRGHPRTVAPTGDPEQAEGHGSGDLDHPPGSVRPRREGRVADGTRHDRCAAAGTGPSMGRAAGRHGSPLPARRDARTLPAFEPAVPRQHPGTQSLAVDEKRRRPNLGAAVP